MYSRKRTLFDKFSLTNSIVPIPRDAVIDSIALRVKATISNATTEYTGTMAAFLACLTNLRLVSNGSNIHYSLSGLDLAVINYYDHQNVNVDPDAAITVPAVSGETPGTLALDFILLMDQGDILAAIKDSLDLTLELNTTVATSVTISAFEVQVSLNESVMSATEFVNIYGASTEKAAEPKIIALEKAFTITEELSPFLDIPTGTLLRRAFFMIKDVNGVRGNVTPVKFGILRTQPDQSELFALDYPTMQKLNEVVYKVQKGPLSGIIALDYGTEITRDNLGLKGWKFTSGVYKAALKSATAGIARMISIEYIVNTSNFDAANGAVFEA